MSLRGSANPKKRGNIEIKNIKNGAILNKLSFLRINFSNADMLKNLTTFINMILKNIIEYTTIQAVILSRDF